ncbi:hypothetical protein COV23_00610 [Candidatus Wolfebacteria bacterium CG10_big_fil_rev_8_21_14_0_10_31_9]|uniref:Major facilitator superfamily (MFS) profile domain-containing protein n=1 Tax=Candidatus Wolfebacteria bacterium CG10_big_fil_rev_8_21_14_0_10_31_9 TaxID=1975070 RepID=A0A2H0RER2_9BACT|nr:MAG: hypothetical protein COV23_00610 [Candidatus Wolfebacteria bacterium CG10_big_fil_rev_8_21_14_0_10_31_9]
MYIKINLNLNQFKINRVVKYFILSDLFLISGWGLINPIFAIFVIQNIPGTSAFIIGALAFVYWVSKAVVQMPMAILLDRKEGEKDDFHALIFALMLSGFAAMAFVAVKSVFWLFVIQIIHGIAQGFYTPSWSAIFSRHLDKEKYAFDWSLDSTTIGVAAAVSALIGGAIVSVAGFPAVFFMAGILSFSSAFLLILVPNLIIPKAMPEVPFMREHPPKSAAQ